MKFTFKNLVFALITFAFLPAMAGIKKSDCASIDWQKKGYEDGVKGEKINKLYKYTRKCDSADAPFSADEYRTGRNEGLEVYCSNKNAYSLGVKNKSKSKKVCLNSIFPDFAAYFDKGRSFVKLTKQKKKLERKVGKYKKYVDKLERAEAELNTLDAAVTNAQFKVEMEETNVNRSAAFMKKKFIIENDIKNDEVQEEVSFLKLGDEKSELKDEDSSLLEIDELEIEENDSELLDESLEEIED